MSEESSDDVRHAAKAAAAAAAVGAAVGLVRTLAERAEGAAQRTRDDAEKPNEEKDAEQAEVFVQAEPERRPTKSGDAGTVRRMTDRAREFLQELSSVDVESVSGLDRTENGWSVTLEAVEVRRIPESTDVLATYEVELDDDGDLVRYERLRRYARAQSDRGGA